MQVLEISSARGAIFVPVSMVAQIMGSESEQLWNSKLSFVDSAIIWREYSLPLIHSSGLLGSTSDSSDAYERAVILWPMKGSKSTDLFALTSLDSPRVLNVDERLQSLQNESQQALVASNEFLLDAVEIDGVSGFIPDLDTLSSYLFNSH